MTKMLSASSDESARPERSRFAAMPTITTAASAAAAVFLCYTVLELLWADQDFVKVLDTLTFPALGLIYAPLCALVAARARGRLRAAWWVMTIGLACWAVGEGLSAYYELTAAEPPFPSWDDVAYLLYVPCVVTALLLFPSTRNWRDQSRMFLDSLIVTGSFFLISWLAVLRTVWRSGADNGLSFFVSLAYPVGDVLVVTVGFLVLLTAPSRLRLTMTLLVAGLVCAALADSIWVYGKNSAAHTMGALPDILYVANALLIIVALVAAYHAQPTAAVVASGSPNRLSLWLPLVPVSVATIAVATSPAHVVLEAPVVITGAVLIGATLFRQFTESAELVRREYEVRRLADQLTDELDSASHYVASILPDDLNGPVEVRSRYLPARSVGGDSFDYTWIDDEHLIVYLVDVSGHGVRSALLSVSVHNLLRSGGFPREVLLAPDRVLDALNTRFSMDNHDDHYFTMWYGVYQLSAGVLRYASAGHPPALALSGADGAMRCTELTGASLPVGMFADNEFVVQEFVVPAGARILLYSDGVLGQRLEPTDLCALLTRLADGESSWLDSLVGLLPVSDDDSSVVLLSFPAKSGAARATAGAVSAGLPS